MCLCYQRLQSRTGFCENFCQKLRRISLTLIMADDTDLYLLLMAEELMIAHLTRYKGIGSCRNGIAKEEGAGSATECHTTNHATQQLVGLHTFHAEVLLKQLDEIHSRHRLRQFTYHTRAVTVVTRLRTVAVLLAKQRQMLQTELLGNLPVHTAPGIVEVGMHSGDADALTNSLIDCTLDIVAIRDTAQPTEDERMVGNNEITAATQRLIDNRLCHVQTQQGP